MKYFDKGLRPFQIRKQRLQKNYYLSLLPRMEGEKRVAEQKKPSLSELIEKIKSFTK